MMHFFLASAHVFVFRSLKWIDGCQNEGSIDELLDWNKVYSVVEIEV